MKTIVLLLSLVLLVNTTVFAQAADVPIVPEEGNNVPSAQFRKAMIELYDSGKPLGLDKVKEQLGRTACKLELPAAATKTLPGGEIWSRARKAHIRFGFLYLNSKGDQLQLGLSGAGYALTADGVVATCFHVMEQSKEDSKKCHVVAVIDGKILVPVIEVLAANRETDVCIVRVQYDKPFEPLPLSTAVRPGDDAWCYSDPERYSSYFSKGIVNRFYHKNSDESRVRMNVSTEWAQGSSGSALLDSFGNAIGHVSEISAAAFASGTYMVFRDAVRAADVQALIKPKQ